MTLLKQLLGEIKSDNRLDKLRQLCDQIIKEENKSTHKQLPKGPNIILALEVPGRTSKEIAFLTLERESEDIYLSVLYTLPILGDDKLKKQRVWEIKDHRPEKILNNYLKVYKYLRGE